jgi:predicted ATPase
MGHRLLAVAFTATGRIVEGRAHFDRAIALYRADEHRALAALFGQDIRAAILSYRPLALWALGFPVAALADTRQAVKEAREIGQGGTLMYALCWTSWTEILCGNYAVAKAQLDEAVALAEEKGLSFWKAQGMWTRGCLMALTDNASDAVQMITAGFTAVRSTGSTFGAPYNASYLARAYAQLGQMDDAWGCIGEALTTVEKTKDRFWEAEVHRVGGEITLMSGHPDAAKAQVYFERALDIARKQQAKSWELRAAMSMARLWRDQGKRNEARELLGQVYGWFTERFDTLDLTQAKALLDELGA